MAGIIQQVNLKNRTPGEHGLPKNPVSSAFVGKAGVEGDFNVFRHEERKDDPDQALLIMPIEMIKELNSEGWPIKPGDLGENFTTVGVSYKSFAPGKIYDAGGVRLQISKACDPCNNLYLLPYVGKTRGHEFLKLMLGRRGWYARVLSEGQVKHGDRIEESHA